MFPAARIGDPITHDMAIPCGLIGPQAPAPCPFCASQVVLIEMLPAAHVLCTCICSGATALGPAHPPIPGPQPPIIKGVLSTLIHNMPAARWAPSMDVGACGVFLGDPKLAATRTVLIGSVLSLAVIIVKGSFWDSPAGRAKINDNISEAERILGINIVTGDFITIDDPALLTVDGNGPWDGTNNYTAEEVGTIDRFATANTPAVVFTDKVGGPTTAARTVGHPWEGTSDGLSNEGILFGRSANVDDHVLAHELGHLLSGQVGSDLHSTDRNNLMHPNTGAGDAWTAPWQSASQNSPYLR